MGPIPGFTFRGRKSFRPWGGAGEVPVAAPGRRRGDPPRIRPAVLPKILQAAGDGAGAGSGQVSDNQSSIFN
jgi:hypothetical protein